MFRLKNEKNQVKKCDLKRIIIIEAHTNFITSVFIFPLGNIFSVLDIKSIKIWDNNFNFIQTIEKHMEDIINTVTYSFNGNIISCSDDKNIKIWKLNINVFHQLMEEPIHSISIILILLLKDKNILMSGGKYETKFWNKKI